MALSSYSTGCQAIMRCHFNGGTRMKENSLDLPLISKTPGVPYVAHYKGIKLTCCSFN